MMRDVREGSVVGRFYLPQSENPLPAILLVSGSDGGIASQEKAAEFLMSQGYAVFLQAYFNYDNLKKELYQLPLKRFLKGVQWLRQQPEVDHQRIIAIGPSKGAEGLLAAAAFCPEMNLAGLVAISPSSVVWQGIGRGKPKPQSSWQYLEMPLPYVPMSGKKVLPQFLKLKLARRLGLTHLFPSLAKVSLAAAYSNVKKVSKSVERAIIPVENINAPLCVIAGEKDRLWPSAFMSRMIQNRRKTSRHVKDDRFFFYPKAGHRFLPPNSKESTLSRAPKGKGMVINFGGLLKANRDASNDAWKQITNFLRQHFS